MILFCQVYYGTVLPSKVTVPSFHQTRSISAPIIPFNLLTIVCDSYILNHNVHTTSTDHTVAELGLSVTSEWD